MTQSVKIFPLKLAPFQPFKIARREEWVVENFILQLQVENIKAYGEAAPDSYYGDDLQKVMHDLNYFAGSWNGKIPNSPAEIEITWLHYCKKLKTRSALNAVDTALWDLMGKALDIPLYKFLKIKKQKITSSSTIGMDDLEIMLEKCRKIKDHPIVKIKIGGREDIKILEAIRKTYNGIIRVDANCGWSPHKLIGLSRQMKSLDVEFIEQPLAPNFDHFIKDVKSECALPIIADESCVLPDDIERCAECFHGVNIKLVKCGGITPALKMLKRARELNILVMVGGMLETNVAVSASTLIGALADYADLDGSWLLKEDPFGGHHMKNGIINWSDLPGLGLNLKNNLENYLNSKFTD